MLPLTKENLHNEIFVVLNELQCGCYGPNEIAERLRINDCNDTWAAGSMYCPVGKWIQKRVPWKTSLGFAFVVGQKTILVGETEILIPDVISEFIKGFDSGKYPQLNARPWYVNASNM